MEFDIEICEHFFRFLSVPDSSSSFLVVLKYLEKMNISLSHIRGGNGTNIKGKQNWSWDIKSGKFMTLLLEVKDMTMEAKEKQTIHLWRTRWANSKFVRLVYSRIFFYHLSDIFTFLQGRFTQLELWYLWLPVRHMQGQKHAKHSAKWKKNKAKWFVRWDTKYINAFELKVLLTLVRTGLI